MEPQTNIEEIIKLLGEHEQALGELYYKYSQRLANRKFWQKIAKDERVHYQWVQTLWVISLKKEDKEKIHLNEEKFHQAAIASSLDFVKKLIQEADSHNLIEALKNALKLEQLMIEKKYFAIFQSDSPKVKQILTDLDNATIEHIERVNLELETAS